MSLVVVSRHCQPSQAKSGAQRIKMQREEKKRKNGTNLKLTKDRGTKNHIKAMLLREKFHSKVCSKTHQRAEEGLKTHKWQSKLIASLEVYGKYLR